MKKHTENKNAVTTNKYISYFIVTTYVFLIVFALISFSSPDWLKSVSKAGKDTESAIFKEYGDSFLDAGEFNKALAQYEHAISINPDFIEVYTNMGVCYYLKGDHKNALLYLKKSINLNDNFQDVSYFYIGEILSAKGDHENAIDFYLKSAELTPFPLASYQKAGDFLTHAKRWEEALDSYNKALDSRYTMQTCYIGMLKKNYNLYYDNDEIKQELKNLLEKGIDSTSLVTYDELIFNKQSVKYFNIAAIYTQCGYIYGQDGDLTKAIEYFKKALQVNPTYDDALRNLNYAQTLLKNSN